ncbi:PREDICTED: ABC transporter G family member 21-like [Nelumbo nucifera]|uniref:ABC transporter G family member 21-like n=1 Tax=Nelumbo nucifera TaxID=4432 RepID=A0A1U8AJI6_NELNU|nr:PREDICTED: ABC transporter G family member 21-like [Nelumbo nucifera]
MMRPPEQELGISTNASNNNVPAVNRSSDNIMGMPRSELPALSSNVSPSLEDQMPEQLQAAMGGQCSLLRGSLRPITLKFEDVSYSIKIKKSGGCWFSAPEPKPSERTILNGVTGVVQPGDLLAMLGPSGSGKTTLLTALAGRLPGKFSGSITYNGHTFSGSIKRKIGFVSQDDVLYPHLTVLETLTYAALLRLPNKLTREEKVEQAELVIVELGLTRCRNSVVGGPLLRGVSGGERKRVSIGQEMLVNPSLLLLDEPTSGLDSTTAQRIVTTLQGLARSGRTVVATIHQPSSRLYRMFDKLVVLSDGCPIYSGSASRALEYFVSIGYMPGVNLVNPADFLLDLATGVAPETRQRDQQNNHGQLEHEDQSSMKQHLISSYKRNLYNVLKAELCQTPQAPEAFVAGKTSSRCPEEQWMTSWWEQFRVLLSRSLKERKHESYSGLRIFQVMSVSILSGLLWWHSDISHVQDQVGLLFFFSIFWGFFPMFNAIFTFPQERPMLIKERSSGMYRLSSYYFARMAGDLPMELVLPTIFVAVTYWMGGLRPSPVNFMLTLLIILYNVLVSQGLGLALGAIVMEVKQATTLASVTMLVFLLAGGYYIQHIPPFIAWLKYSSFSHYCYKLLVGAQYTEDDYYNCGTGVHCKIMDFPSVKSLGLDNKRLDVAALTVMLVGYRLMAYVALRIGQPH